MNKKAKKIIIGTIGAASAIVIGGIIGYVNIQVNEQALYGPPNDEAEITLFNRKFVQYEGLRKGSEIRTMVQEIMAYNNSAEASDKTRVSVNVDNGTTKVDSEANAQLVSLAATENARPTYGALQNTKTYIVKIIYNRGRAAVIEVY